MDHLVADVDRSIRIGKQPKAFACTLYYKAYFSIIMKEIGADHITLDSLVDL